MMILKHQAGGYLIEPKLQPFEQGGYWFGTGVFLTILWGGFVLALLFGLGFSIWLFLILLLFSAMLLGRAPEGGVVALILLTMLFESSFTLQPITIGEDTYKLYFLDILLLLVTGAFAFKGRFSRYKLDKLDWAVLGFDVLLGIYFLAGLAFGRASEPEVAFSTFKTYAFYSLIYFLARRFLRDERGHEVLKKTFYLGGFGILAFLLIGFLQGQGLWVLATPLSTAGDRLLAPTHAFYLLFPLLLLISRHELPFGLAKERWLKPALIWIWTLGIVFSLARHLWIVLGVTAAALWRFLPLVRRDLVNYFRTPLIGLALVLIALFGFSFAAPGLVDEFTPTRSVESLVLRVASVFSSDDASFNYRAAFWREGLKEFASHPFFGIGLGQNITFPVANFTLTVPVREMHNSIFALAVQAGLLGILAFFYVLWQAFKQVKWHQRDFAIPAAALIGVLIASLFGTYFEANFLILFFWLALAWVGAAVKE